MGQCILVDGLQKTRSQRPVHRHGAPDYLFGQSFFFHFGIQ
jgi:hypothetical protein